MLLRWLRRLLVWAGPVLVLFVAVASGFLFWTVRSESGTRWALQTAVEQLGGQIRGVRGTLWDGVSIEDLALDMAGFSLAVDGAHLRVDWPDLGRRRLHVVDLSAKSIDLNLHASEEPEPDSGPFRMPALPVSVAADRIAVGRFAVSQDGEKIPVDVRDFASALSLTADGAQVALAHVAVSAQSIDVEASGDVRLLALREPWPVKGHVALTLRGRGADSPLCARRYLPTLPTAAKAGAEAHDAAGQGKRAAAADRGNGGEAPVPEGREAPAPIQPAGADSAGSGVSECSALVDVTADGDMDKLDVSLSGRGQGLDLQARASLAPMAAFPLHSATVGLNLADGSSLHGKFDWVTKLLDGVVHDRVSGAMHLNKLDVGALAGPAVPAAVITADMSVDASLLDHSRLRSADVKLEFGKGSRWNDEPLSGHLSARVASRAPAVGGAAASGSPATAGNPATANGPASVNGPTTANGPATAPPGSKPSTVPSAGSSPAGGPPLWRTFSLDALDMDLALGPNHLKAKGALGVTESSLDLDVRAPRLAAFWPTLSGKAEVSGKLGGTIDKHRAQLTMSYTPGPGGKGKEAAHAAKAKIAVAGQWGSQSSHGKTQQGWRGTVSTLDLDYDGLGARILAPLKLSFVTATGAHSTNAKTADSGSASGAWQWEVGAADVRVSLLGKSFVLHNKAARGGPGWWAAQGGIAKVAVSRGLIKALRKKFAPKPADEQPDMGRVHVQPTTRNRDTELVFAADWDLKFKGALSGKAHIRRLSGDIMVPGQPSFPLGLQELLVDLTATPKGSAASQLDASVVVSTKKMGRFQAKGSAVIHTAGTQAWSLDTGSAQTLQVKADIADLSWVNLLLGDETELGGALKADVQARSVSGGGWKTSGTIRGRDIKFIRIDDGVRLFNGTLDAHLDGTRIVLDSLRFPAELRVTPKEWRTATWIKESPDAKDGSLTISGYWDLFASAGVIDAKLYRYPILQRSDRYAMVTGKLTVTARLPEISITGKIDADAGWFNLDVLGSVPSIDGDVVVIRPGQEKEVNVPAQITLDLQIGLGPRFYLTGYGVNSGLVGSMHILMAGNKLTGVGELRTRGGSIDVYGQHLQLRRGTVTFQGNITNPVLSIEALRTDAAVQAGVRVGGTAKRPKIDLVSYPDVSEVEKLSWLLLGRAPDAGGGDMALLFSVGTSILGGGEPFYRKLGLDELGIRTGELGSTGSILPPESVVSGLNKNPSDLEQQFAIAGKHFGNGVTLSLEQALAATGTVGRASYRLSRRLRAELSVGTVNGIALIYHVFFDD